MIHVWLPVAHGVSQCYPPLVLQRPYCGALRRVTPGLSCPAPALLVALVFSPQGLTCVQYNTFMPPSAMERPRAATQEKFRSPEEELAYLRERVREKEQELEIAPNQLKRDRIAKRETAADAETHPGTVLHEAVVMPEHDVLRNVLKLEPEIHDVQMDELLKIVANQGIK